MAENKQNNTNIAPENDFLEDLSNLSNDLKHPEWDNEDDYMDSILEQDLDNEDLETETQPENQANTQVAIPQTQSPVPAVPADSPDNIQDYVLQQCKDILQQGKETLEQLQDTVVNTCDGKAINGYATLVASLGKVLDTANAIGLEKSRIKSSIEMENLKHQHRSQMKSDNGQKTQNNTVNIIAGREEIMKMITSSLDSINAKEAQIIE